jgi:hypothetical protein
MVRPMGRPIAKKAITLEDLREESLAHCEARNQAAGPWSGGVPDVLSSSRAFPKTSLRPHPSFPVCTHGRRDRRPPVDRAPGQTSETNGTHGIHGRAPSATSRPFRPISPSEPARIASNRSLSDGGTPATRSASGWLLPLSMRTPVSGSLPDTWRRGARVLRYAAGVFDWHSVAIALFAGAISNGGAPGPAGARVRARSGRCLQLALGSVVSDK